MKSNKGQPNTHTYVLLIFPFVDTQYCTPSINEKLPEKLPSSLKANGHTKF